MKKTIKKIILSIVIITLSVIRASSVYLADNGGYNGDEGEGDTAKGDITQFTADERGIGFMTEHTGYRFYIIEQEYDEGELLPSGYNPVKRVVTDAVDIYMSTPDSVNYNIVKYNLLKESDERNTARSITAHTKSDSEITASMPAPIVYNGQFEVNGREFKNWMLTGRGERDNNATGLVRTFWGEDILEEFLSKSNYRLVVEPIIWSNKYRYKSNKSGSYWKADPNTLFLGTAYEWARYMSTEGDKVGQGLSVDSEGKGCYIQIIYSCTLPNSLVIERQDGSCMKPEVLGQRMKAIDIMIKGYGEHLYSPSDIAEDLYDTASTQTYDPKLGAKKGSAPVPSKLKDSTIIKVYEDVDADGNIIKTSIPYIRMFNPNRITVNDETNITGYTVVEIYY